MGSEVVVPLLYDPNSNITKVAHTNPSRTSRETILKNIDKVLKGALQDYQQGEWTACMGGRVPVWVSEQLVWVGVYLYYDCSDTIFAKCAHTPTLASFPSGGSHFNECSLFTGVKAVISHRLYDSF